MRKPTYKSGLIPSVLAKYLLVAVYTLPFVVMMSSNAQVPRQDTPQAVNNRDIQSSGGQFPVITLPRRVKGEDAIQALGERLPEVALQYRLSAAQLRDILRFDRTSRIDTRGQLYFEEEIPRIVGTASDASSTTAVAFPLDQTFKLHSRPGAARIIYLNFLGGTLVNTNWNAQAGQPQILARAFDLDGSEASFNDSERTLIQGVWQRVAEDYSPFGVDVTTEAPPSDALIRSSLRDTQFGTAVLVTRNTFLPSCNCGGVAYVGVFDDINTGGKPALVFFDALSFNEKYIAEATSHEVGHTVGLVHDGVIGGSEYYTGQGSGATGWAPIMGVGYYKELVQFSRGEYANANNTQDDFVIMSSEGLSYRADDHANTLAGATVLVPQTSSTNSFSAAGVIERATDIDTFKVTVARGSVSIRVTPAPASPNLDVTAVVYASDGSQIATLNPTDTLDAATQITAKTDTTIYVAIMGSDRGDPRFDGYSRYGSVGQYNVSVKITSFSAVLPAIFGILLN